MASPGDWFQLILSPGVLHIAIPRVLSHLEGEGWEEREIGRGRGAEVERE